MVAPVPMQIAYLLLALCWAWWMNLLKEMLWQLLSTIPCQVTLPHSYVVRRQQDGEGLVPVASIPGWIVYPPIHQHLLPLISTTKDDAIPSAWSVPLACQTPPHTTLGLVGPHESVLELKEDSGVGKDEKGSKKAEDEQVEASGLTTLVFPGVLFCPL